MITIFLVVLWLANGAAGDKTALVEHQIIPEGVDCGSFAAEFIAKRITGNPNYSGAKWLCLEAPADPEEAA